MAAAAGPREVEGMVGARVFVALLAAALLLAQAVLGSEEHRRLLGAPVDVAENDEGLQRALQFAMAQYNRASNDKYSSRVVRIISAQRQLVSGIKYTMEVEIGRTTCTKATADPQSCSLHDTPEMAKRTTCNFVVYTIPWLNEIKLLKSSCK
ncbi:cystatin-like isoform X1 [Cygnus olor]|uniref:cystatin-like isoform X1 n=2 Tax=Cygnus olor TaxID=8869 RepID=UPI001ADDF7B3|nr:cystatin-like isoform X1 [Cygnus olor]